MADYPDLDEEYELTYADEFELLREAEEDGDIVRKKSNPARRTLDFTSPVVQRRNSNNLVNDEVVLSNRTDSLQSLETSENLTTESLILSPVLNENVSNKRTIEDLFGDINDIDFNTLELPSKKQKTEEERDLELIERIIEGRRLKRILDAPKNQSYVNPEALYNCKDNISVNIPRWAFLPITNSEGERVYVKLESEDVWDRCLGEKSDHLSLFSSYTNTWEEARRILETKKQEMISESQQPLPDMEEEMNEASLWVDKYKPLSYIDLLSEEPVNRALLHWLHLWDQVVFKKEVKVTEAQQRNSFSKRAGQFQLTNKWKSKKDPEPEMDKDGRPHHKVALLCGPPGVGKTTLAHLLARLAGYRPLELNASNERSTEEFRKALQGATQMRSVLGYDRRPNCLILDEIDGAPIQTVELLVKWCTATSESGSKKAKTHPLKRPVIAICNNLYATSLRPLRPVSLVISVGGVSETRLGERLCRVAAHEGLTLAPHVAAALAARAQGDVRAAIQVLSFIKARAKTQVSMEDVNNAAVGTKDCTKNLMQALNAIFTLDNKQHNDIVRTIQTAGEYDRIAEGIFEHYVSRIGSSSRLDAANSALSWLRLYDVTNAWILRHQNYAIYGSLPHYLSRCRAYLASRIPQARLGFPMQALEMRRRRTEIESIEAGLRAGCGASVSGTTRRALLLDVLPLLPYLLAPSLRSANVQLLSDKEREVLRTCASAMCDYGLQYTQQRTPDGLYEFLLEPDIYKIAFFGNEDRVRPLPSIRQTISREQQLVVIRRNQLTTGKVNTEKPIEQAKPEKNKPLPNHLQRLTPMAVVKKAPQVQKDFFGRIVPIAQTQTAVASTDVISSSKVFYQYREGFNNAVRRNVRMRDLL